MDPCRDGGPAIHIECRSSVRLTIEENPERIKRFSHIKPASRWGAVRCAATCPGTLHACTLERGHSGPHVAHRRFGRVVAVWEEGVKFRPPAPKKRGSTSNAIREERGGIRSLAREEPGTRGLMGGLAAFGRRVIQLRPSPEELFLLFLALTMVGFAIDAALRIIGWR